MNEPENTSTDWEASLNLSDEDRQAHQSYLRKNGLDNLSGADPEYEYSLKSYAAQPATDRLASSANELPEFQAEVPTTELKFALTPKEAQFAKSYTDRFFRASHAGHGSPHEAVADTYSLMSTYWSDAQKDITRLNMAFITPKDRDPYIDPLTARSQPHVRETLGKYINAYSGWARDSWPGYSDLEFKERQKESLGLIIDLMVNATDPEVVRIVEVVYALAENRSRFWSAIRAEIDDSRLGKRVAADPRKTITSSLLPKVTREPEPDSEPPVTDDAPRAAGIDFQAIFEANVSKPKQTATKKVLEDWNEKWEAAHREAEQGRIDLTTAIKDRFGDLIPIVEEGRVVGLEDPDEYKEKVSEVRRGTPSRKVHKKGPQHYISPRDKGAPENILKDIKGSDS
jgi:hypothetical protein